MISIYLILLASYLMGCFTTGYYLVRLVSGNDIRTVFSGNVGSRNVGRLLGTKGFILTFIGDAGKGLLAVWMAMYVSHESWFAMAALFAATAGHIWPVQLRFQGGKGLATFTGGMILLQPLVLGMCLLLCAVLYPLIRGATKTGLIALACSPLFMATVLLYGKAPFPVADMSLYCLLSAMVLYAHRSNIKKDFCGEQPGGE
jgi:glycerol-3-phosphate acyltransferase PlsY